MRNKYRIIEAEGHDGNARYDVQYRQPFGFSWQATSMRYFDTVEDAEKHARLHAQPVVKFLGKLP